MPSLKKLKTSLGHDTDQVVTISILFHRVDVEIVKRRLLRSHIGDRVVRLVQCNMVAGVPGKDEFLDP